MQSEELVLLPAAEKEVLCLGVLTFSSHAEKNQSLKGKQCSFLNQSIGEKQNALQPQVAALLIWSAGVRNPSICTSLFSFVSVRNAPNCLNITVFDQLGLGSASELLRPCKT